MKRYFLIFLAILFPVHSYAYGYLTPYGAGVTISKYHVHGEGGVTLWVAGSLMNPGACADISLVHIPPTLPGYKAMVAAVMEAYALNKKIGLHQTNCSTIPFWGGTITYPIIGNLWVTD